MRMRTWVLLATLLAASGPVLARGKADPRDRRIEQLERTVRKLLEEVAELKGERALPEEETPSALEEQLRALEGPAGDGEVLQARDRFAVGGYGEIHVNFGEGGAADQLDFHRFVLYLGHEFADWILLDSELEIEHALVGSDAGGEVSFEQLSVDLLLSDLVSVRIGRVLTPIGIVNEKHEPPSFNGVERPTFARVIVPSTWSSDGVGIFGRFGPSLAYEVYLAAGLDGSGFDAASGIRGGRMEERPGLNEPAVTGRLDWFPFVESEVSAGQVLRLGASGWFGGIDNGNRSVDPGLGGRLGILSADFEYTVSSLDFRGAGAYLSIDGAREIGRGTASAILGWYMEAAVHVWPSAWRAGKLARSDLVLFVRYEDLDTQFRMPRGVPADGRGDRREVTLGLTLFLQANVVLKLDYQIRRDGTARGPGDLLNLGIGWQF